MDFTQLIEKITFDTRINIHQEDLHSSSDVISGKGSSRVIGNSCGSNGILVYDTSGDTATIIKNMTTQNIKIKYVTRKDSIGNCGCYYSYFGIGNQMFRTDTTFHQCRAYFSDRVNVGKTENLKFIIIHHYPSNEDSYCNKVGNLNLFIQTDSIWQYHSFQDNLGLDDLIFCDINKDKKLDYLIASKELTSEQIQIAKSDTTSKYFNINIMTNKKNDWEIMTNKKGEPYFIFIKADDYFYPYYFEIVDYNWIKRL